MPYITLEDHLPGITGLLEYRLDTAKPIRELTQLLLRGSSTLAAGERELIATLVSHRNNCRYCTTAHTAVADMLLGECETTENIKQDIYTTSLTDKMKMLLNIAGEVQTNGKNVTAEMINNAKEAGATDLEIHDTVLIAALFSMYNRYVDSLSTVTPVDSAYYRNLAERISVSYNRLPQGYDHVKKNYKNLKL